METALRLFRTYQRLNEAVRRRARAAAIPILALVGLATVAAWAIGRETGNQLLLWSPAAYAWILGGSYVLAKAWAAPAGWAKSGAGYRRHGPTSPSSPPRGRAGASPRP